MRVKETGREGEREKSRQREPDRQRQRDRNRNRMRDNHRETDLLAFIKLKTSLFQGEFGVGFKYLIFGDFTLSARDWSGADIFAVLGGTIVASITTTVTFITPTVRLVLKGGKA